MIKNQDLHPEDQRGLEDSTLARAMVRILRRHVSREHRKTCELMGELLVKVGAAIGVVRSQMLDRFGDLDESLGSMARELARRSREDGEYGASKDI